MSRKTKNDILCVVGFKGSRLRLYGSAAARRVLGPEVQVIEVQGSEVPFFALRAAQGRQSSARLLADEAIRMVEPEIS